MIGSVDWAAVTTRATFLERLRDADFSAVLLNGAGSAISFCAVPSCPDAPLIPLIATDGVQRKTSILSPTAHYVDYPLLELGRKSPLFGRKCLAALALPWKLMFRSTGFDRVVYVNHWLLNGPALELSYDELGQVINTVKTRFPHHTVVFSGIVPALTPHVGEMLAALGGRAVQSRTVHLLDLRAPMGGRARRGRRAVRNVDRRLYESRLADRITDRDALLAQVERMEELYSLLYLRKYSSMNPQYTREFFRLLIESDEFYASGWCDRGRLEAFNFRLVKGGVNWWSTCGYDTSAPKKRGLFRLIATEDILGPGEFSVINWGAGNAGFKGFRGAEPALEYDVVFDDHLPARRRLPWRLVGKLRALKTRRSAIEAVGRVPGIRPR